MGIKIKESSTTLTFILCLVQIFVTSVSGTCTRICLDDLGDGSYHCVCLEDYITEPSEKRGESQMYNQLFKWGRKRFSPTQVDDQFQPHGVERRIFRWGKRSSAEADDIGRSRDGLTSGGRFLFGRSPGYSGEASTQDLLALEAAIQSGALDYYDILGGSDAEVGKRRNSQLHNPIFKWGKRSDRSIGVVNNNPVFKWGSNDYLPEITDDKRQSFAQNHIFKWGKRSDNGVNRRYAAPNHIFKWGKRSTDHVIELQKRAKEMHNAIFKWGKREDSETSDKRGKEMLNSLFKWGKRDTSLERNSRAQYQNSLFKWGKRSQDFEKKYAPNNIFKWGKRSDKLSLDKKNAQNQIFKWGNKDSGQEKIQNGAKETEVANDKRNNLQQYHSQIFKWGKRLDNSDSSATIDSVDDKRQSLNPIFKWGKRGDIENAGVKMSGVRNYDPALSSQLFKWGKRISGQTSTSGDKKASSQLHNPIFKWGKRNSATLNNETTNSKETTL